MGLAIVIAAVTAYLWLAAWLWSFLPGAWECPTPLDVVRWIARLRHAADERKRREFLDKVSWNDPDMKNEDVSARMETDRSEGI